MNTCMHILFELVFLVVLFIYLFIYLFLDIYPGVELLDNMLVLFLVFWGTSTLFSIAAVPIYIPTNSDKDLLFSTSLPTFLICCLAILTGVGWYLIMVWICTSLMIRDAEHLSMCLFYICLPSLEKCLFKFLDLFFIGHFFIELYELFIYFGLWPNNKYVICKYFLPFNRFFSLCS